MKHFYTIFIIAFLFSISFAQINWTKYDSNPVLSGRAGWAAHIFQPSVLYNDDSLRYEMWFGASDGGPDWLPYKIGFATSPDGIDWSIHADLVLEPDPGTWDEITVEGPMVLHEEGLYKMWYTGYDKYPSRIGYATSPNGIDWTKHGPVAINGHSENTGFCAVLPVKGGGYEMWFDNWDNTLFYATSDDGISWVKGNGNKPVLTVGSAGQWDDTHIIQPHVLKRGDNYHMWYTGTQDPEVTRKMGYATSSDGINWNKYNNPDTDKLYEDSDPVLVPGPQQWDNWLIESGSVMVEGDSLRMWYAGRSGSSSWKIGQATTPLNILNVPSQYATIQAGIDAADNGQVVLVEEGTYYENINFKGKAITVASRFWFDGDSSHIEKTIIDGSQPANPDQGSVVSFTSGEDTTSVLYGLTIRGGTGSMNYTGSVIRWGGGVLCFEAGAKLVGNHIIRNHCSYNGYLMGGGVCAASGRSSSLPWLVLKGNRITDNMASGGTKEIWAWAGGVQVWNVNARIEDNIFARDSISGISGARSGALDIIGNPSRPEAVIKNNTFMDNVVYGPAWGAVGGAILVIGTDEVLIEDNLFTGNKTTCVSGPDIWAQGGAIVISDETITNYGLKKVLNNRFIGNSVFSEGYAGNINGGAILLYKTWATIDGNTIINNSSGSNSSSSRPSGAGIATYESRFTIVNNIISGNSDAYYGGGIDINRPQSDVSAAQLIVNNTIYNNQAQSYGGGVTVRGDAIVNVMNNIIYNNSAGSDEQLYVSGGSVGYVNYNDIEGGYEGTGNIDEDPLFIDTDNDDFHLSDISPCIDAGNPDQKYNDPEDPLNPGSALYPSLGTVRNDIGRYGGSWDSIVDLISDNLEINIPNQFVLYQNYPNPFNPKTNIEYRLTNADLVNLSIYNLLGQKVATLVNKKQTAGSYQVQWDAGGFASGIYIYTLETSGGYKESRKLVLLK